MTLFHALGPFAAQGGVGAAPGMVLMKPTSITHSGTSATLGANGQVTFTAVTSLSLNGCFTADFDNYVVALRVTSSASGGLGILAKLRVAGTDTTGTDYTRQNLSSNSTSVTASRELSVNAFAIGAAGPGSGVDYNGFINYFYGPFLAQPTAHRLDSARGYNGALLQSVAGTHSLSSSYDGFTMFIGANNITGALQVYGVRS